MDLSKRILLNYPSRGRPQQLLIAFKNFIDTWSRENSLTCSISVDRDDPSLREYYRAAEICNSYTEFLTNLSVELLCNRNKTVVEAVNRAYTSENLNSYDIISLISDDFRLPQDWDKLAVIEFEKHGYDKILKTTQPGTPSPNILTLQLAGTQFWKDYGTFVWHEYLSVYGDTDITGWAMANDRIVDASHMICRHLNPGCNQPDGFPMDATYQRENSMRAYQVGEIVYNRRKAANFSC